MSNWRDTSLGLLPSDWDTNPLGNLLYIKGRIGWKGLKKSEYLEEGYAIINGEQIIDGKVNWQNVGRVPKDRYDESPEIMLKEGDILMTKDGTIGKLAYVDILPEPATVASGIFVIRKESELLYQKYLYYFFRSHYFEHLIKSRTEGSVIPHLYQRDFTEMEIPLPKRDEQIRIAKMLSVLDKKIDNLKKQNNALEAIAQTLFKHWFIDFEFPDVEGRPYKSSGGKMIDSEFGNIPIGWSIGKLGDIAEITSSKRIFYNEYEKTGIPFYRSKEIIELHLGNLVTTELFISNERFSEITQRFGAPKHGDILLTSVGTIGIPYIGRKADKFYFKDGNLTWFKNFSDEYSSALLYTWILSPSGKSQIQNIMIGSTQKAITIQGLKNIPFLFLNNGKLSKTLNNTFIKIRSKIENNLFQLQQLSKLQSTLLPQLISGKIRIKN